jgi:hypothetical protein
MSLFWHDMAPIPDRPEITVWGGITEAGFDRFGPRARNTLGELICLNCGAHVLLTGGPGSGARVTCSVRCRMQLWRRGGRMDWKEFRLRVACFG